MESTQKLYIRTERHQDQRDPVAGCDSELRVEVQHRVVGVRGIVRGGEVGHIQRRIGRHWVMMMSRRVPSHDLLQSRRLAVYSSAIVRLEAVPVLNEPVLDEGDAEAGAGAVLGSVGCVQEIREDEAGELEEVGDEGGHKEGEDGPRWEVVDDHVRIRVQCSCGSMYSGLPVRRNSISLRLGIRL